jgi:4a-hydroxytetrahydrobiopterin dehydratase
MKRMSYAEIEKKLASVPDWKIRGNKIRRRMVFQDFVGAMGFLTSVALLAESMHHHPLILIEWNKVTLTLWTHTEGGLTKKDFALAREIDSLSIPGEGRP